MSNPGFGREEGGNGDKYIGFNLIFFCYKEFEKLALCEPINQSEFIFLVYSEPIVKCKNFSKWQYIQNVNTERTE